MAFVEFVAPRVAAGIAAARGVFPFCLGRQPILAALDAAEPLAELLRIERAHIYDRMMLVGPGRPLGGMRGVEFLVLAIRDREARHVETTDRRHGDWLLVGLGVARPAAHGKHAGGDEEHLGTQHVLEIRVFLPLLHARRREGVLIAGARGTLTEAAAGFSPPAWPWRLPPPRPGKLVSVPRRPAAERPRGDGSLGMGRPGRFLEILVDDVLRIAAGESQALPHIAKCVALVVGHLIAVEAELREAEHAACNSGGGIARWTIGLARGP